MEITQFDDIRPYNAEEIPAAMERIANSSSFPLLASYVYPDEPLEEVRERIANYKTVREFQTETMRMVNQRVIEHSISEFSCSGLDKLDPEAHYLFVSNHRDIMLDSSLLQYFFVTQNFDTTEITFGANLMMNELVVDIGKSNKMFKVERPGNNIKDFYRSSKHLSEYIRYVITQKGQSVWIAQRNGRTKDGNDTTDQGIIKMFCMSCPDDKLKAIDQLHIVPVAVSYEWEPCDVLKTLELYESQFSKYTKKPGEDLNSILTGIVQEKGKVHFELCEPISYAELAKFENVTNNEYHKLVAQLLDSRIRAAYRLYPNNYIAYDLRYGTTKYKDCYTDEQKKVFMQHLQALEKYDTCDIEKLKDIFLGIYSNPVNNK
ncbi:1-acyl-sn-glycerol-3-phosphate acyltransferase [Prevotella aurantiaca]|uniref:1-acyl-sn-glycerol-3-phosphate acyltransferase n=1 Tax=Prevotella aurantiaca TaxID=596085 RepID=A0A930N191_9BACT|nr:1-acyl-sn-glycerol-3-phosphate acyltransferase [Prevotella aurantiaca]MBF1384357.1 1-acyl-sn-glycerol-3-phosphate acyltransferase [Prevotella aurantiaca]